jgi:hypothetical protein
MCPAEAYRRVMDRASAPGGRSVFTVPRQGDDDTKFREWTAANRDLFVVVSERRPRPRQVELHSAGCTRLIPAVTEGPHLRTCGTRETLEDAFSESEIVACPACL